MNKNLPIEKKDIQYNPHTQEVTLKREKFDELMGFVRDAMKELDEAEEAREIAEYRVRRSTSKENVYETIMDDLGLASNAITKWVDSHSIQELSKRSGIPYATCQRIVDSRLKKERLSVRNFKSLLGAIKEKIQQEPGKVNQLTCFVVGSGEHGGVVRSFGGLKANCVQVGSGAGLGSAAAGKHPDIVIVDISMPDLKSKDVVKLIDAAEDS